MTSFDETEHPRASTGQFTDKPQGLPEVGLAPDALALTAEEDRRRRSRIRRGDRPDTDVWRPFDSLRPTEFLHGGHTDELYLKSALLRAPVHSVPGGPWTVSRATVVRDIDDDAVDRDAHGGRMFDMLAERGFLTPLDDERRDELAPAYAARQEEFGSTLPDAQRLEEAQELYELDRGAILAIYPELTVNGDGWREHAAK
ncbi:hypothetical protein [Frigoribacterium sp. SL97]|uniref:hypothetical protein n=1 Tax=Frigoribacterium sp. SL97 TaxID=2994664 RepID=UPI00226E686F|nr:hypothetical protein [Frigoribacterium sp. SL97]WAC50327.1 hypothetical protein OVA02_10530 [Frigoribacterium sp. SL97]